MDSDVQEEIPVREEFFFCGGVETQIIKCGPWTNLFDEQSVTRPKLLVFVIPGNPGFSPFYLPFAKSLYSLTKGRFPVWMISHAGFALAPKDKKILAAPEGALQYLFTASSCSEIIVGKYDALRKGRSVEFFHKSNAQEIEDIYGLNGQIQHKIAFLRAHVPKDVKLILIGHSIGSYIVLRVMKDAPELPVIHSFLLFPTIERMAETPNGRIATPLLCWFRYALYATGYLVLKPCPEIIKSFLIKKALERLSFTCEIPLENLLQPFCLANAVYLGSQEMMQVRKRDDEAIKELLPKLTFYYGKTDGWCPVKYYEDMKKDFPGGDIRLCEKGISHAFVLGFSQEVAAIVADWMNNKLPKI